jgi:hypothetical protein
MTMVYIMPDFYFSTLLYHDMILQLTEWSSYFSATCGSAATLTGLIFVGASISLQRILALPKLTGRALESLLLLIIIIIISSLCLVPGQTYKSAGIEILCIGVALWLVSLRLDIGMLSIAEPEYKRHYRQNMVLMHLAVIPYIIAGILLLREQSCAIYFIVPGFIVSFLKALLDAWVLLIEINR